MGHVGGVEALTQDHKPNKPSERKATEARGGKVVRGFGCARVDGVLAVSRALGDISLKPHGTPRSDVSLCVHVAVYQPNAIRVCHTISYTVVLEQEVIYNGDFGPYSLIMCGV